MTFKDQLVKLKQNWLLLVIILVLLLIIPLFSGSVGTFKSTSYGAPLAMEEMALSRDYGGYYPSVSSDFAPEVDDRILTKTAYLSSEINRGDFYQAAGQLKSMVEQTDSFLLNENVNRYGERRNSYYQGSYQIKVETTKYSLIVEQLKELGEVESFSENTQDITGRYTDLQSQIETEEARLDRYEQMFSEAKEVSEKIELTDLIFNQDRRIEQLKDYLENLDNRVDYSTISVTLREETSGYANIAVTKFSGLIRALTNSFNGLLKLIFWILPFALVGIVIWLIVRRFRK